MSTITADVVIIGGAAVGSAIAYFLKRDGFKGRVCVVEMDPSYQWCASGRAVAGIRQQFSTPENIRLSQFGVGFYKGIKAEFGVDADISFRERGYMVMASPEGRATLEANVACRIASAPTSSCSSPTRSSAAFPGSRSRGWVPPAGAAAAKAGSTRPRWCS